jgi:hypothetical protein
VVLQIAATGYIPSEPFLVPLLYDPLSTWGAIAVANGVAALEQAMSPLPTADFNRDSSVDSTDLSIWQAGYGTLAGAAQVAGDATGDGAVTGDDFLAWQRQSTVAPFSLAATQTVPEPSTLGLLAAACLLAALRRTQQITT